MEDLTSFAYGFVGDIFVVIHKTSHIDDDDWRRYMRDSLAADEMPLLLVVAGNAKPDVDKRHDIRELYDKFHMRIGVMADSKFARGILTALRWFGIDAKGFPTSDLDGVLTFLDRSDLRPKISSVIGPYLSRATAIETGS